MASKMAQTSESEENKCRKCEQSNNVNPLVPSLILGQESYNLCPLCLHETQWEELESLEEEISSEEKEIKQESVELSELMEDKPADKELKLTETRQKACGAIKLMMRLQVPKQKDETEEVGKLEPTFGDVQLMEALVPDLCLRLRKGSLRQFHSILHPENNKVDGEFNLKGTLFDIVDSQKLNKNVYEDSSKRAKKLVKEMKGRKSKKVILLDGHGRTLLSIIHAMIEQGEDPDSYEYVVVDIDQQCQCFHEHFFPQKVTCKHMNILDIELGEADMLYMNFCSIPSRVEDIIFNKEEVLKWIWERVKTMKCGIMISTVIRDTRTKLRGDKEELTAIGPRKGKNTKEYHLLPAGFQQILEDEDLFGATLVSKRQIFMTWLIAPEKCAAKYEPDCLKEWFDEEKIVWDRNIELCPGALVTCDKSPGKTFRITKRTPDKVDLEECDPNEKDSLKEIRRNVKDVAIAVIAGSTQAPSGSATKEKMYESKKRKVECDTAEGVRL